VLLMNLRDLQQQGLGAGDFVTAETVSDDGVERRVDHLRVEPFDIPVGCVMGYFPELNRLIPLFHHARGSKVPAAKSIPIRLIPEIVSRCCPDSLCARVHRTISEIDGNRTRRLAL
jgi:anaerobic selenocysteine-containing dehydrogenase